MAIEQDDLLSYLQQIDEYEFERFIAELLGLYGWKTQVTSGSNDRGIDIIAEKERPFHQKHLIQVKRWGKNNTVGGPDIRQYSSLRHGRVDADVVVVVTTSSFSSQAKEEANDLNVKLVDGADLCAIIAEEGAESLVREYTGSNCPHCENTFEGELRLHQHLCQKHKYIECPHCDEITQYDSALREHICKKHGHEGCSYCKATFQNESGLREHLSKEHGHSECPYCGVLFQSERAIRKHLSENHKHGELSRIDQKRVKLYNESTDSSQ